jgi:ADP-heptose:LPS heptosyltransferase
VSSDTKVLAACTGGGVGDLLAALPAMRALCRHFGRPVDLLATPYAADIVRGQPCIDETLVDDGRDTPRAFASRLRARGYSCAVVFWSNPRIAKIVAGAGIPVRVGQSRRLYSFRYTKRVAVRSEAGDTTSHWSDIQMDYARTLGAQPLPEDYLPGIPLTAQDRHEADGVVAHSIGEQTFIIFHAARGVAAHAANWPSAQFAGIADGLVREFGASILLTGSKEEAALCARTAAASAERVRSVAGQTTLRGFAALAQRAALVVALDSGPMHVAAAVGAPTVGIFALRTDHPQRWRPLGPRVAIVGPSYPCPARCRKETCRTFACYAALDAGRVVTAARNLLRVSDAAAAL